MPVAANRTALWLLAAVAVAGAACAARAPSRPQGPATPAADVADIYASATRHCTGLRSLTAELGLSGRAGEDRIRGRILIGLERGGAARLEGVAPFGAPIFILVARAETATLLLPRDQRVLRATTVSAVLERLTGLPLGADDLLRALTGCMGAGAPAADGQQWPGGWRRATVDSDLQVFLREQTGRWAVVAVDTGRWRADFSEIVNDYPRSVRLRSSDGRVDLTVRIQQPEVNTTIDAAAFDVEVPPGTSAMTIDELRTVAPLKSP